LRVEYESSLFGAPYKVRIIDKVLVLKGVIVSPFAIVVHYLYPQRCIVVVNQPQKDLGNPN
jgi:hypothetical protein